MNDIERVARAINDIAAVHEDWDKLDSVIKTCRRIEARAAILAFLDILAEPSEEALENMQWIFPLYSDRATGGEWFPYMRQFWQAMLAAKRKEIESA